mgnify:CR=1 FL=1
MYTSEEGRHVRVLVGGYDKELWRHLSVLLVLQDSCALTDDTSAGLIDYLTGEEFCEETYKIFLHNFRGQSRLSATTCAPPVPASVAMVAARAMDSGCPLPPASPPPPRSVGGVCGRPRRQPPRPPPSPVTRAAAACSGRDVWHGSGGGKCLRHRRS